MRIRSISPLLLSAAFAGALLADTVKVELSESGSFEIPGGEENCLLVHSIEDGLDEISFNVSGEPTGEYGLRNSIRISIGGEPNAWFDDMRIQKGEMTFQSLGVSGRIAAEAERDLDKLTDEEYYAMHDRSEEAEGQRDSAFSGFVATVAGKPFLEYANEIRTAERFPKMRAAAIAVRLADVAVLEASQDNNFEYASVAYAGRCSVSLMLE